MQFSTACTGAKTIWNGYLHLQNRISVRCAQFVPIALRKISVHLEHLITAQRQHKPMFMYTCWTHPRQTAFKYVLGDLVMLWYYHFLSNSPGWCSHCYHIPQKCKVCPEDMHHMSAKELEEPLRPYASETCRTHTQNWNSGENVVVWGWQWESQVKNYLLPHLTEQLQF